MILNDSSRQQFEQDGYLVVPGAIAAEHLLSVRQAAEEIVEAFDADKYNSIFSTRDNDEGRDLYFMESAEAVHCFLEEDSVDEQGRLNRPKSLAINKIGHALHDLVPEFAQLCHLPVISQILDTLGYSEAQLWQSMYIYKQPQIGGEVRWHQDASYLITSPPRVIGMWLALEDANRDNACLWVQPGGHRSPLREIFEVDPSTRKGTLKQLDDAPWPAPGEGLPVEVSAGSLVMFSDHMPHFSSKNHSKLSRQAFTMHFAPADATWSDKNWLQREQLPPFVV